MFPTERERRICDLARRQLAALARDPEAMPERSIVRAWGLDFGGVDIPNVRIGWRLHDGGYRYYADNVDQPDLSRLAAFAGFSMPNMRGRGVELRKVVRALAVHFLHRSGGGDRTLEAAHTLFVEQVGWSDERWERGYHHATIRRLTAAYGPLTAEAA